MKIVGPKVLVEISEPEETTESGVFIPVANRIQNEGTVILVGDRTRFIKVGDKVRYYPHCGSQIEYEGKNCLFLKEVGEVEVIL